MDMRNQEAMVMVAGLVGESVCEGPTGGIASRREGK